MFDIGFLELVVVGVLGLLVLGPERLPKAARTIGLVIGRVRRTMSGLQDELERQVRAEELKDKLKDPYATFLDDDDARKAQADQEYERLSQQSSASHEIDPDGRFIEPHPVNKTASQAASNRPSEDATNNRPLPQNKS